MRKERYMRDTSNYRTKTQIKARDNGKIPGIWEIAIDIGYSGVKAFSPNCVLRFPSYAKKVDQTFAFAGEYPQNSILYKDLETGELWLVGEKAQDTMSATDTTDSEQALYGRERYDSPMFKVLVRTGLGMCLKGNDIASPVLSGEDADKIVIQTGLPERYMSDTNDIIEAFAGGHDFKLKIADGPWLEYHFAIDTKDVFVISQPKGTLFSVCTNKDGSWSANAKEYLGSSMIVFDPGFGTLDIFPILNGVVGQGETFPDLGMKRILQETTKSIREKHGIEIPVAAMQKYLSTGIVKSFNKKTFASTEYPFGDYLAEATSLICNEALSRMVSILDMASYDYLVITGGTGAAWYNQIKDRLSEAMIQVIPGNQNDNDLPFVYSNVRGYYYYRFNKLRF